LGVTVNERIFGAKFEPHELANNGISAANTKCLN
jgi:hypothetical protein